MPANPINPFRRVIGSLLGNRPKAPPYDALFQSGRQLVQAGDWDGAAEVYRAALDAKPPSQAIQKGVQAAFSGNRNDEAYGKLLQSLWDHQPDNTVIGELMARHHLRLEKAGDAEAAVTRSLRSLKHQSNEPGSADRRSVLIGLLAQSKARKGERDAAFTLLDAEIAKQPEDPVLHEAAGQLAQNIGDLRRARDHYHEVCRIRPDQLRTVFRLASLEFDLSNGEEAIALTGHLNHKNCMTEDNFLRVVFFHIRTGRRDRALALIRNAVADGYGGRELEMLLMAFEIAAGHPPADLDAQMARYSDRPPGASAWLAFIEQVQHAGAANGGAAALAPAMVQSLGEKKDRLRAGGPSSEAIDFIEQIRSRLVDILDSPALSGLRSDQSIDVSYICPIHRPWDIDNAVKQIGGQSWRNAEAVFAINSADIDPQDIRSRWTADIPVEFVDCVGVETIGGILNRGVSRCRGDIVLKFDADNYYLEDYALNMLLLMRHYGSKVAVKANKFRYFAALDMLTLRAGPDEYLKPATWGASRGGATLCFYRHLNETIPFQDYTKGSEDNVFLKNCIADGLPVHFLDPFNYVTVRSANKRDHTWAVDDWEFLRIKRPPHLIGGRDAIDRFVRV